MKTFIVVLESTSALRWLALRGCEHFLATLWPSALRDLLLFLYRAYTVLYRNRIAYKPIFLQVLMVLPTYMI